MFCSKCGNKLVANASFCGRCGTPVKKYNFVGSNDYQNNNFVQDEVIIEIEEKEKKIVSLASNNLIYGVIALTMILSISFIAFISFTIG